MATTTTDPKGIVREFTVTESRRGFRRGDAIPSRQFWPSVVDAEQAMAGNEVAYRIYQYADDTAGLSILSAYIVISRAKKSRPWRDTGRRVLASCNWDADTQLEPSPLKRAVDSQTWIDMQTRQHLRAVGIKSSS